jgi:hypothetical protein
MNTLDATRRATVAAIVCPGVIEMVVLAPE